MAIQKSERVRALDVARGIAMLLVCVAHFFDMYALQGIPPDTWYLSIVSLVCRVATPTFVLVSGIVLGYQVAARGELTAGLRTHLLDRALFVATVGHALIALAYTPQWGYARAFGVGYVTDTIAFCVIGGLFIVPVTGVYARSVIGGALLVGSLIGWQFWTPAEPILLLVKSVLLGPIVGYDASYFFPLLPWLGWYLVGSVVGSLLGREMALTESGLATRLVMIAAGMIVTALAAKWGISYFVISLDRVWFPWTCLFQKYPPGPMYLLVMGGTALLLVGGIILRMKSPWMRLVDQIMEPVGKNSLPVFIAQFFVYFSGMYFIFHVRAIDILHGGRRAAAMLSRCFVGSGFVV